MKYVITRYFYVMTQNSIGPRNPGQGLVSKEDQQVFRYDLQVYIFYLTIKCISLKSNIWRLHDLTLSSRVIFQNISIKVRTKGRHFPRSFTSMLFKKPRF